MKAESQAKLQGNAAFKANDIEGAISHYTDALNEDPSDHTVLSNRSFAYAKLQKWDEALIDAEACVKLDSSFAKGYLRKGQAEQGLGRVEDAMHSYEQGLEKDPNNAQLKQALQSAQVQHQRSAMGEMFSPAKLAAIAQKPPISQYMADPEFKKKWDLLQLNPQAMLSQLMQTDPRFIEVFGLLSGIDLGKLNAAGYEMQQREKEREEEERKKREQDQKKKEEEEKKREEEERIAKLSPEERQFAENIQKADNLRAQGNKAYNSKNFQEALALYQQALQFNPDDLSVLTNMAAVHLEQKNPEKAMEMCDEAIRIYEQKGLTGEFKKIARAYARKGAACKQLDKLDEAIDFYDKAMLEDNLQSYKDEKRVLERIKKQREDEAYIDPEKAEEARALGNQSFKNGKFPEALKYYDEGVRRDPKNAKIFSNRAFAYIKLMRFNEALDDCERCLKIDPTFVKAYARKGNIHELRKEFHKAIEAYEKGLKIDPTNADCLKGKEKVNVQISMGVHQGGQDEQARAQAAMNDPEIRKLMMDPRIKQVLKDMEEGNSQSAMEAMMKDNDIKLGINKLIAAGIIKMG